MTYKTNSDGGTYISLMTRIEGVSEDSRMNRRLLPQAAIEKVVDIAWDKIHSGDAGAREVAHAEDVILEVARVDRIYARILGAQMEIASGYADLYVRIKEAVPSAMIGVPPRAAFAALAGLRSPLIR